MNDTFLQWQTAWPAVVTTALLLPAIGLVLNRQMQLRQQRAREAALDTLDYLLGLMQRLQRHRALGGRSDPDADRQRAQLASELERLWRDWPQHLPDESTLPTAWPALKQHAGDFDGHCRLIDQLLAAIELVERRAFDGNLPGTPYNAVLGTRCRTIEELGQLRGLSVRAAASPTAGGATRCPVQLEVPLRYLCLRLADAGPDIANALREIEQRLLVRRDPTLTPADCFALLTPLIDRALEAARAQLHRQARQQPQAAALSLPLLAPVAAKR